MTLQLKESPRLTCTERLETRLTTESTEKGILMD